MHQRTFSSRISPLWYSSTLSNPLLESEKSLGIWNRRIGVCSNSAVVGRALTSRQVPVAALPLGGQALEQAAHLSFQFLGRRRHSLSCVRLCDPMDCRLPGSSVRGVLQARIQWVAIPFSREPSPPRGQIQVSCFAGRFFTVRAKRK